ncbi:DinI family protein [Enterobacter cloacae subsp. cloacae]|uniref:DinI-like family protein n=1 Tax=Enterobacter cloacae TaxID=550 RepID=UPI000A0E499B|nr:DinI-like family protein [Enterobacter cloacae]ORC19368.1 DinI family protein [Enterobacter cloacae subsp. cloacae]ORC33237.1 DinI family protein [Enterobacter cloacae subsp. cloacae]
MDRELSKQVMLERVELIARLTTEGVCQERDREIALNLIAELAHKNLLKRESYSVVVSARPCKQRLKRENEVRIHITLDNTQNLGPQLVEAFESELNRRVKITFPSSEVTVKQGSRTGIEIKGFPSDSDRERLDGIIKEVWEDASWH